MDIAGPLAHRALLFVASVRRQHYSPTVEELNAYIDDPERRSGRPERREVTNAFAESIARNMTSWRKALGIQERIVDPGEPAESVPDWLGRLNWLEVKAGRVRTTLLGDAVLAHLEQQEMDVEMPVAIKLDRGDKLAMARVIGRIAELGPCLLIDPYLSLEVLIPLLQTTEVKGVLTSQRDRSKIAELKVALPAVELERPFEIRTSDAFHDRFIIPDTGPIWSIGTSLTGIGARMSVMLEIGEEIVATAIRAEFQRVWDGAEVLVETNGKDEDSAEDDANLGQRETGDEEKPPAAE